jgi:hypothetical protein
VCKARLNGVNAQFLFRTSSALVMCIRQMCLSAYDNSTSKTSAPPNGIILLYLSAAHKQAALIACDTVKVAMTPCRCDTMLRCPMLTNIAHSDAAKPVLYQNLRPSAHSGVTDLHTTASMGGSVTTLLPAQSNLKPTVTAVTIYHKPDAISGTA